MCSRVAEKQGSGCNGDQLGKPVGQPEGNDSGGWDQTIAEKNFTAAE